MDAPIPEKTVPVWRLLLMVVSSSRIRKLQMSNGAKFKKIGEILQIPWVIGLLALVVYVLAAYHQSPYGDPSIFPYFNYLADAFLHGQLNLRLIPANIHDLVFYQGQYYLYWPPFPAVMLMPLVAVFGVGLNDYVYTAILAAINVSLLAVLLKRASERGILSVDGTQRTLLVIFFAFGTAYFPIVPRGTVWFSAQTAGIFWVILTYLATICLRGWKAFLFTGLALAAAFLTRNNLLFVGVWPAYYLIKEYFPGGWRRLIGYCLVGLVPVVAAGLALLAYNWARFGSPMNVGLDYHLMSDIFQEDYSRYGAFNLHYLPTNFYYQYLFYPLPIRPESPMGGSMFLLSPLFFAAFWAPRSRAETGSQLALLGSILLVDIPILLLMGTGWVQYGPRYTLDFIIPLLFLTAMGMRKWPIQRVMILVMISIVQYLPGALIRFG
jgi:hypothetical protein